MRKSVFEIKNFDELEKFFSELVERYENENLTTEKKEDVSIKREIVSAKEMRKCTDEANVNAKKQLDEIVEAMEKASLTGKYYIDYDKPIKELVKKFLISKDYKITNNDGHFTISW